MPDSVKETDLENIHNFLNGLKNKSPDTCLVASTSQKEYTEFGKSLKHIPKQFRKIVANFCGYLADTKTKSFKITFKNNGEIEEKDLEYIHRWTATYKKTILAKLYSLENSFTETDKRNITMLTLTVSQRGLDQQEALKKLMENYTLLFKMLRKHIGTYDYFYVLEPHKTGYAHMHILYKKIFSVKEKEFIYNLWEKKYGAGVREALNFSEVRASTDINYPNYCSGGAIKYIRSYMMKYMVKGLYSESMTKAELLFNALLKENKIRMWNCSRNFSKIMKKPDKEVSEDYECVKIEMFQDKEFVSLIYPAVKVEDMKPTFKYEWVLQESCKIITDSNKRKISMQLMKCEYFEIEIINKHGKITYEVGYNLYVPILIPLNISESYISNKLF